MDRELMQLARNDGAARLALGRLVAHFLCMRGWERFGFARLGDYGAERVGWSGRQLEQLALVARRLAGLPQIETALRSGALSWSKARLIASIASAADELRWLAVAAATDVRALAAITAHARAALREQHLLTFGKPIDASIDEEHSEERVLVRVPCTRRVKRMWNEARRHAPRMTGRSLSSWQVAELVAAEASSLPPPFEDLWQQEPWRSLSFRALHVRPSQDGPPAEDDSSRATTVNASVETANDLPFHESSPQAKEEACFDHELENLSELDVFALDAAMRRVRRAMQQRQARLGALLGLFLDLRLHGELGYSSASSYVTERLGLSERTARELVRVAKAVESRSPVLTSAYANGDVSWLQALTLLPVARPGNASAWVRRAQEVTLRRLVDEVDWTLERVDEDPACAAAMPPAPDEPLARQNERQMCAEEAAEEGRDDELWGITGRIHVSFVAPLSASVWFRSVLQGFAAPTEPRWKAFERMLEHVLGQWHDQPRHRDPVFARDGYRCTAPGCSSFANLHDHHIVPRSAGGSNDLDNRTTLCAWHHLRAVHGGLTRVSGQAPDGLEWQSGLVAGEKAVMHLRGERYVREQGRDDTDRARGHASGISGQG